MKIVVVANTYPSFYKPNFGAFVYNLVQNFTQENEIIVVSPLKITDLFKKKTKTYGIEKCKVIRPLYFSFGNKKILGFDLGKISSLLIKNAFIRGLNQAKNVDVIYAHFLKNGYYSLEYVKKNKIPLFIASGESQYLNLGNDFHRKFSELDNCVNQYIAVSNKNKEGLINLGVNKNKIQLIPNAVDYNIFKPLDINKCKEQLGIPKNKFVIGFIGHFIHRKGPNRIIQALKDLNNPDLHLICVGEGGILEENNFTTILPPMPNYKLNEIFNSFDVFVLPTLHEGHCNVIEEAKAACIPIISSKGTSVESQLNEDIGILIDPLNINEISKSIEYIYSNKEIQKKYRENLNALRGSNSIQSRANKILKIINNNLNNG